jgi:hypothetical protein
MCSICDLKIDFKVDHPLALTVAVATREAIDAGRLPEKIFDGALASAKLRVAAIDALKALQRRLEDSIPVEELMALPDFYVLLIEVGTWGFFHATEAGFDPDCSPEPPVATAEKQEDRDVVFVATESVMQAVLEGRISFASAVDDRLIVLDAGAAHAGALFSAFEGCGSDGGRSSGFLLHARARV